MKGTEFFLSEVSSSLFQMLDLYIKYSEDLKERDNLGNLDVDGKIVLKLVLSREYEGVYCVQLTQVLVEGFCETGNKLWVS
jgi:hypothetical protein